MGHTLTLRADPERDPAAQTGRSATSLHLFHAAPFLMALGPRTPTSRLGAPGLVADPPRGLAGRARASRGQRAHGLKTVTVSPTIQS